MKDNMQPIQQAWLLLKELDTEDLRQAARTGGIGMTPERRDAYTDAGLPQSTGGGFRTMPDTEAAGMMRFQRDDVAGGYTPFAGIKNFWAGNKGAKEGPVPIPRTDWDLKDVKIDPATGEHTEHDWHNSQHVRDEDMYTALHGGSMEDPSLEQEREPIGRFVDEKVSNPESHPWFNQTKRVPRISNAPSPYKEYLDNLIAEKRNKETALPEGHQGPEEFPTSEFARRGDASTSPSGQAFEAIQQRRGMAEAHERVLADRQREIQMRSQSIASRPQRGRRGQGRNSQRNRRGN